MAEENKRILIIEEDIESLTLIYTTLLPLDYQLEAALEVAEIKLRMERFRPNLLLISSEMADAAGSDTLDWACSHYHMQVIIMERQGNAALQQPRLHFIADTICKPVSPAELLFKINSLLLV